MGPLSKTPVVAGSGSTLHWTLGRLMQAIGQPEAQGTWQTQAQLHTRPSPHKLPSASSVAADRFQAPFLALLCRRMPRLTHTNLSLPFAHHSMAGALKGGRRQEAECRIVYDGMPRNCENAACEMPHRVTRFHLIKRRTRDRGTRRFSTAALDLIAPWATVLSRPSLSFCTNLSQGLSSPCIIRIRALTVFSSPRRHLGPNSALSYSFTDILSSSAPAYPYGSTLFPMSF
ncbi:hypothetical protein CSPX01_16103 [Colletotrichum filicis]|nr:hypothetical protein CSPX01_16103 [Colletotrichum filicis]